jgi:uncharacterized membrane protein
MDEAENIVPEGGFGPASFKHPPVSASREIEILISDLLRYGVIISLCVVIFGTIVSFVHHPDYLSQKPSLHGLTDAGATFPHTVTDVLRGLMEFQGRSIVMLGLLLLIATPVLRVAVSIFGFVYEADSRYVVITTVVLALLILSFVLGRG